MASRSTGSVTTPETFGKLKEVKEAQKRLAEVISPSPLQHNMSLSEEYGLTLWLKREDQLPVRSYKLRGAYNKIAQLSTAQKQRGVICASAGNHAQGVAYSCKELCVKAIIVMPETTPNQKVSQVNRFGQEFVEIVLHGDTFDDAKDFALELCKSNGAVFIHPFDDEHVIVGQATIAMEILEQCEQPIDVLLFPIGGGGLAAGCCTVFKELSPNTLLIGIEPEGAASMKLALHTGEAVALSTIETFVDGAAVKQVGQLNYLYCKDLLHEVLTIPTGTICTRMLKLYNEQGIVVEPAGALTLAALDLYSGNWQNKRVVAIVSGGNNDITRMEEIKERSLIHEGLKHYFLVDFPQRPGALKQWLLEVLGPNDDITYFQYIKKHNKESGPAIIGVELKDKSSFQSIESHMKRLHFTYEYLNDNERLFTSLIR